MALAHHEIGVHLVTTLNGRAQPLKVLSIGCPLNTMTQEGMTILAEYLAGCLTIKRLKILALRVLAVDSMLKEKDFRQAVKDYDWAKHQDQYVAIDCSADAIVPIWSYMLISNSISPYAKMVVKGNIPD